MAQLLAPLLLSLLLLLLLIVTGALGDGVFTIQNANDFIELSTDVSNGVDYSGTTVFLDADLDFLSLSQQFEPVGNDTSNCFRGTFDGQGHTISNLAVTSSSLDVGLFGYSKGLTIRSVVIDDTCSLTSNFTGDGDVHVGGIIGHCQRTSGSCTIENSVNMGSVTFNGNTTGYLFLGGIAGYFYYSSSSSYESIIKNCANYGSVTHSGQSTSSRIGGIVGGSYSSSSTSRHVYIQNCLNTGTITHNGTTQSSLYIGEIAGHSSYTSIENCVSAGIIASNPTSNNIGGVVGYVSSSTLSHCYWSENIGYDVYGTLSSSTSSNNIMFNNSFVLSETVSAGSYTGTSLVEALNAAADHYTLRAYSPWALNKDGCDVAFTVNGNKGNYTLNSQIILLPSLATEGALWFNGWYTDSGCTTPLADFTIDNNAKELHGKWGENRNSYTTTFDTRGGASVEPITREFGAVVSLPSNTVMGDHCTIGAWETGYGDSVAWDFTVPAHNTTLYAVWKCTRIATAGDFIDFSKLINSGVDYSEMTLFLDADLDFLSLSQQLEPVGKDDSKYFRGTLDGQGHTISNLAVTSSSFYVGLFGYSGGLTIRNVVIDDTCSFISNFTGTINAYVGGIIGYYYGPNGPCTIENTVNMGSVTFNGNTTVGSTYLYLGGVAGHLSSSFRYESIIKNCANYGSVTHSGQSTGSFIGGVVGGSSGSSSSSTSRHVYIQNCLNTGTITHNGTTSSSSLYIGGIVGYNSYTIIENCASAGTITSNPTSNNIGGVVGYVYSYSTANITHSFWTSDVGYDEVCGKNSGTLNINDGTSQSEVNASLVDSLNSYSSRNSTWTGWLLNPNNASVVFRVNGGRGFAVKSQVVLLPSPADNSERVFSGWYSDKGLTAALEGSAVESDTTLYGVFCGSSNYTVRLDVDGWDGLTVNSITVECNGTYAQLPGDSLMEKSGYTFSGWYTGLGGGGDRVSTGDRVTNPNNHTLHAQWTPNNYTVTLDMDGWSGLAVSSIIVTFNSTYAQLPDDSLMERSGYVFVGWFNDAGESVTNETSVLTPSNHTLHARWEGVTAQVEIVFVTKDLSRESVVEILKQYTGADFDIVSIEESDDGKGTRVIIKFVDKDDAENFVETIRTASNHDDINKVNFIQDNNSLSPIIYPAVFTIFLVI